MNIWHYMGVPDLNVHLNCNWNPYIHLAWYNLSLFQNALKIISTILLSIYKMRPIYQKISPLIKIYLIPLNIPSHSLWDIPLAWMWLSILPAIKKKAYYLTFICENLQRT